MGDNIAKKTVVRRNELVLGHFRLSVWGQRLFLYIVSHVEDDDDETVGYEFNVADLARELEIDKSHLYYELVRTIHELESTKVRVERVDGGGFWSVGLIVNKQAFREGDTSGKLRVGDGRVCFYLHKELLPYVQALRERFTKVELRYVLRLRSSFSQKLYDILKAKRYQGREVVFAMPELKSMLGLDAGEFAKFGDFRRYVLERAQAEISERTDLRFSWTVRKSGNAVSHVVFTIETEAGSDIEFLPGTQRDEMLQRLTKVGMADREAAEIVRAYAETDSDRIAWHLAELARLQKLGKVKKPLAWLRAGLKKDYRPQLRMSFEERQAEQVERKREAQLRRRAPSAGSGEPKAIGELLGTNIDPALKAALTKMAGGVKKAADA